MVRAYCEIVGTCHPSLVNEDLSQLFWLILQHLIFATKVLIKGNIRVRIGRVSKC